MNTFSFYFSLWFINNQNREGIIGEKKKNKTYFLEID